MNNVKVKASLKSFPLVSIMERSDDIWGIKDCESRFIYTNRAFREFLNIPARFKIEGKRDEQLPTPLAEFASELKKQDQETIKSGQRVTLIKTHFFGREQKLEPYLYEKFPLYDEKNECVGTVFYGKKMDFISMPQYVDKLTPSVLALEPPSDLFTTFELKIVFHVLQSLSAKEIGKKLSRSNRTIENHLQTMYRKSDVNSLPEFKKFCNKTGFDRYIPQEFIRPRIQFMESRRASL
ncbi:PAS domain-containing protein (plasmid) [Candidatus Fukatsuia symbiotica]|uniref:Transcriptional regulator n=1 Tax=Candidatus Fukatsuia symbiotica TaxID=1878942 RepID=A0A2Y9CKH9_9GAMM|nr:PAS domain-containing protein [Candidatus Fukatsuia symbiotica]AWK15549.1 transcriptional regulator [Candidatus Fukatsuia symbiotica]MEA9445939.1 PAS domain-containing protein [Candidatus Fukatsuia symbiotica]